MTPITEVIQQLGLQSNITQSIITAIQTGIGQLISYVASSVINMVSSIPGIAAQMLILIFSIFMLPEMDIKLFSI